LGKTSSFPLFYFNRLSQKTVQVPPGKKYLLMAVTETKRETLDM
jgi:hypothetical protein